METFHLSGGEKDTDSELVAAAKCGDAYAFEKLVLRHERRVLAAAQRITNNREDAEDAVQEGFHKAFRKRPKLTVLTGEGELGVHLSVLWILHELGIVISVPN